VTVDFNRDRLFESLRDAGYDPTQKTFFTWEGVCMYIPEEGVRETLSGVSANAAPGSRLVMDYTTTAWLAFMKQYPQFGPTRFFTAWNEPWVFGLPDGAEREFFESVGLAPREFFPGFGPEALKRYLTRPDGTVLGSLPANAAYPQLPPEAQAAIAELNKNGASVYALAELEVSAP
jgi:O-methyltransferase involved in polyketide biosynthesis